MTSETNTPIESSKYSYRLPAEGEIALPETCSQAEYRAAREDGRPIVFVTEDGLIRERLAHQYAPSPPAAETFEYSHGTMSYAEYRRLRREGKEPKRS